MDTELGSDLVLRLWPDTASGFHGPGGCVNFNRLYVLARERVFRQHGFQSINGRSNVGVTAIRFYDGSQTRILLSKVSGNGLYVILLSKSGTKSPLTFNGRRRTGPPKLTQKGRPNPTHRC